MEIIKIKYRSWFKGGVPKQIKLDIPGWAGNPNSHSNGSEPQPWHCPPFVEGSTYGIELCYPFDTECHVRNINGSIIFDGDFEEENKQCPDIKLPPFVAFASGYFGMTSSLDIKVPEGYVLRTEPHPRFYTDCSGTVPCCLPGHIQTNWWPKIFFVVFKAPKINQEIIFRKAEPYGQALVIPRKVSYDIEEMTHEEKVERTTLDNTLESNLNKVAKNQWKDNFGNKFSDKYKQLSTIVGKSGYDGMKNFLNDIQKKKKPTVLYKCKLKIKKKNKEKK